MNEIKKVEPQTSKVLLIGALAGAVVGLGTAYFITQSVEDGDELSVDSGQGLKLGLLLLGTVRQVAKLMG